MDKFDVIQPYLLPIVLIILGAIIINCNPHCLSVGYIKIGMRGIMKEGRNNGSLWSNPLFGISLSVFAYLIGMMIFRRFPHPITTPLLVATVLIIGFLKLTGDFL